ncbi:RIP metalloprotease RseP [Ahniella affigens]|uniref:Zinc metalloprotease n=1 Tax=Ahniella affigens TaxID=2021234 RepID=A0A2P1PMI7_9GAMM|nr:RIP metalloprotease RseP [Ahniella affigens]AVP96052.1 RIP metalloprotease RseP [Ahniella affigens]
MDVLQSFFGSLFWYIVAISVLITVHEFGHFWVARRAGVTVKRFSIGFGKPLWMRRGKDGTEYAISMIPFGGYVAMLDERYDDVPPEQQHGALNRKHPFARILISLAGPAFNLILAVGLFWIVFMLGKIDYQPLVGSPSGLMEAAGLTAGDRVLSVDNQPIQTWEELVESIYIGAAYSRDVNLMVASQNAAPRRVTLALSSLPASLTDKERVERIGLRPHAPATVAGLPDPTAPAAKAGIEIGDRFVSVADQPVASASEFIQAIQTHGAKGGPLKLGIVRAGQLLSLSVRPRADQEGGQTIYRIGVETVRPEIVTVQYGPIRSLGMAMSQTVTISARTVVFLKDMVVGDLSPKQISGPITIARVAAITAERGLVDFLGLLAAISVGLAILNLLPVPILDGGHIVMHSLEWLFGRALNERELWAGQAIGLAMVAGMIGLAFFNDFARLLDH